LDRRAVAEVRATEADLGEGRVYALTGARLEPASPLAKLRWLARHEPDLLERARLFLPPKDYLRFRLTGEVATEPIDAAGTLLYDLRRNQWSPELAAAACISTSLLPPVQPLDSLAGALQDDAATALGLPGGIPVATGAGDDVECLGAGLLATGQALEHIGTTGSMLVCSEVLLAHPTGRVDCYPHAVPGLYLLGGSTSSAGATLAWAARQLATDAADGGEVAIQALLDLSAGNADDGSADLVFLPYLAGERCPVWHPGGRGLLLGMTLRTTQEQIIQAVFTGVAFSLRHILDCIRDLGLPVEAIVASGGGGTLAGDAWPALRSTVYGYPLLQPPVADSTSLGALALMLVALGVYPDAQQAAARLVPPPARRVDPVMASRAGIERRYALYRAVAAGATSLFDRWLA
jgi:xylulokinase